MHGKEFEDLLKKIGGGRIGQMVEIFKDDPKALENFLEETAQAAIPDDPDGKQRERFITMLKDKFLKPAAGEVKAPAPASAPTDSDED